MKTHFGELLLSLISLQSDPLQFYQNKTERLWFKSVYSSFHETAQKEILAYFLKADHPIDPYYHTQLIIQFAAADQICPLSKIGMHVYNERKDCILLH